MIAIHKLNGNVYEFYIDDDTHEIISDNLKEYGEIVLRHTWVRDSKKLDVAHRFLNKLHLYI